MSFRIIVFLNNKLLKMYTNEYTLIMIRFFGVPEFKVSLISFSVYYEFAWRSVNESTKPMTNHEEPKKKEEKIRVLN